MTVPSEIHSMKSRLDIGTRERCPRTPSCKRSAAHATTRWRKSCISSRRSKEIFAVFFRLLLVLAQSASKTANRSSKSSQGESRTKKSNTRARDAAVVRRSRTQHRLYRISRLFGIDNEDDE